MKHKSQLLFVFWIVILCTLTSTNTVYPLGEVKKAKDFMQAGMYPQAIALLDKRINEKPTDAEAHYQLGICYINTGKYNGADKRFSSAVRLGSEYGYKIGGEYKRVGSEILNKGRVNQALALFRKAAQYQPNLKKQIAQECFTVGQSYLNQRDSNTADRLLSMAQAYDASLTEDIKKVKVSYGKKLLEIARKQFKKERRKYIDEARKYLDQKSIDAVFPPPGYKTIFRKKYFGRGMGDDDCVETVESGKHLGYNDKIIVRGNNFQVFYNGDWCTPKKDNTFESINKNVKPGEVIGVKAPKGEPFTVEIQRITSSY